MKNFMISQTLLVVSFILQAAPAQAALPAHWVNAEVDAPQSTPATDTALSPLGFWKSKRTPEERSAPAQELDRYISAGDSLANEAKVENGRKTATPWYLQSIKAELGIEAGGEIGFMGLEGEAAIELIWKRTREAVSRLKKDYLAKKPTPLLASAVPTDSEEAADTQADITLAPDMSEVEIQSEVESIVESLGQDSRIKNLSRVRSGLLQQIRQVSPVVSALARSPNEWRFKPYKFQVELFIQAEGKVAPIVEVGAITRVRLEWPLVFPAKKEGAATPSHPALNGLNVLVQEMDRLAQMREAQGSDTEKEAFKLFGFKAGVGLGGEIELGVAELKGHALGSVFFRYQRELPQAPLVLLPAKDSLARIGATGDMQWVPYDRLTRGMQRAFELTDAITARAARHERKAQQKGKTREFELSAVEVELELSANGNLVLAGVSKKSAVELFFTRGGNLPN